MDLTDHRGSSYRENSFYNKQCPSFYRILSKDKSSFIGTDNLHLQVLLTSVNTAGINNYTARLLCSRSYS